MARKAPRAGKRANGTATKATKGRAAAGHQPQEDSGAPIKLIAGSRYEITSLGTRDNPIVSQGIFREYSGVGSLEAIVLELDEKSHKGHGGTHRLIPSHMVLTLDVLEQKDAQEEQAEEDERSHRYYL